jgi:hypothetical protein
MPKVIVLVADSDDPKHGEIAVLDSQAEAERFVETLLETGTAAGRVRVFAGGELEAQVTQKPRVELVACEWAEPHAAEAPLRLAPVSNRSTPAEEEPVETADGEEPAASNGALGPSDPAVPDGDRSEPALTLLRRQPVRPVELMPELKH